MMEKGLVPTATKSNKCTLELMVWLMFFFFLALMFNEDCVGKGEHEQQLSVSSSIACGPSRVFFLVGVLPISIEIIRCAWYYQCIHNAVTIVDNLAFLLAPVATTCLVFLTCFDVYGHNTTHMIFATTFFVSVYFHTTYVAYQSICHKMDNKNRCVCALWIVASFIITALLFSKTGWCERCVEWFAATEVAYMCMVAVYAYLLKTIVDAKGVASAWQIPSGFSPCKPPNHEVVPLQALRL
jgi:hypothetical protein